MSEQHADYMADAIAECETGLPLPVAGGEQESDGARLAMIRRHCRQFEGWEGYQWLQECLWLLAQLDAERQRAEAVEAERDRWQEDATQLLGELGATQEARQAAEAARAAAEALAGEAIAALHEMRYFVLCSDCGCCVTHSAWQPINERAKRLLASPSAAAALARHQARQAVVEAAATLTRTIRGLRIYGGDDTETRQRKRAAERIAGLKAFEALVVAQGALAAEEGKGNGGD